MERKAKSEIEENIKKQKIENVIKFVKANRDLPVNEMKRKLKKQIPDINSEELINILVEYSNEINKEEER